METSARLARRVVEALELDTPKREWDVTDELFAGFGVAAPERGTAPPEQYLDEAAALLAAAVDRPADLLNAFLRIGGRFLGMLDEVYVFLARHLVTVERADETVRVRRDEVDADVITISPAFLEEVRRLERRVGALLVGHVDHAGVRDLTVADNGEFYGDWRGVPLLDGILHLAWLRDDPRADPDRVARASAAADRVVRAAEALVRGYLGALDVAEDPGPVTRSDDPGTWLAESVRAGDDRYREHGFVGTPVYPGVVTGTPVPALVGLDGALRPVEVPGTGWGGGGPVGALAGFVALARQGRWSPRLAARLRDERPSADDLARWLDELTAAADEAADWLADGAVVPDRTIPAEVLVEVVEELLALPLWQQRELLYEVWVLVLTIEAARGDGRSVALLGVTGDAWTLGRGGATQPVALLDGGPGQLAVWREPLRRVAGHDLTPDVTVATTGDLARDLVVVEAKDRLGFPAGTSTRADARAGRRRRPQDALAVALRYAVPLRPALTWVVDHCDLAGDVDPAENLGDPWTAVHLGSGVRPGDVPDAFAATVRAALSVPGAAGPADDGAGRGDPAPVVVLLDATRSMADHPVAWDVLTGAPEGTWRAVVFRDHTSGTGRAGPFARPADLVEVLAAATPAGGTGATAAIEDALRAAREVAEAEGPQTVLLVTDAVPDDPCPRGVDHREEVDALLAGGSRLLVATDWIDPDDEPWRALGRRPGGVLAPLDALLERVARAARVTGPPAAPGSAR